MFPLTDDFPFVQRKGTELQKKNDFRMCTTFVRREPSELLGIGCRRRFTTTSFRSLYELIFPFLIGKTTQVSIDHRTTVT